MINGFVLDNDVIFKTARYCLLDQLLHVSTDEVVKPLILAAAPFVLHNLIQRSKAVTNKPEILTSLGSFVDSVELIEPSEAEIEFAAEMEEEASAKSLSLDTGESILTAITIMRDRKALVTGDKRAIYALRNIRRCQLQIVERILCFEQIIYAIVQVIGFENARALICADPNVDTAISLCFSCAAGGEPISDESWTTGLESYITHLRLAAPDLLRSDI
jgi:hypothetical protein